MKMIGRMTLALPTLLFLASAAFAQNRSDAQFAAFLVKLDAAQVELQNGKPEAFKSIWSRADDVTLSGGFGGKIEKGWAAVSKRLDWAGSNFSKGTNSIERLAADHGEKLGYVVQIERIKFIVPETGNPASRDYRVTMVFRREKDGWRLVHRHADSNNVRQAPQ